TEDSEAKVSEAIDYSIDADGVAYTAERLRRAVLTLAAISNRGRSSDSSWPRIVRDWRDAYGYHAPRARRFEPSPKDMDEYLIAYDWLAWLTRQPQGKRDYQIIVAKAFGTPTWKIAQRYG